MQAGLRPATPRTHWQGAEKGASASPSAHVAATMRESLPISLIVRAAPNRQSVAPGSEYASRSASTRTREIPQCCHCLRYSVPEMRLGIRSLRTAASRKHDSLGAAVFSTQAYRRLLAADRSRVA